MAFEQFDTRELFARLLQCEAGGEGEDGMTVPCCLPIFSRVTLTVDRFPVLAAQGIPAFAHSEIDPFPERFRKGEPLVIDSAPVAVDGNVDKTGGNFVPRVFLGRSSMGPDHTFMISRSIIILLSAHVCYIRLPGDILLKTAPFGHRSYGTPPQAELATLSVLPNAA